MLPKTRQDHIHPLVRQIVPCVADGPFNRRNRHDTMVVFTNGTFVCSSGHCNDDYMAQLPLGSRWTSVAGYFRK